MLTNRLIWRLYPSYIIITLLSLAAVLWYTSYTVERYNDEQEYRAASETGKIVRAFISKQMQNGNAAGLDSLLRSLSNTVNDEISVLDKAGNIIASTDSLHDIRDLTDYTEIQQAMRGNTGQETRYNPTHHLRQLFIALPIQENGQTMYIVRVAHLLPESGKLLGGLQRNFLLAGIVVILLAALAAFWISRLISKPLEEMRFGAERFARGELGYKLPSHGSDEMKALSKAMNEMAEQLDNRLRTEIRQRNEQQAILSSLVEGVLAVDTREQIISVNEGAERLLGINEKDVKGRSIQEAVRNSDLQQLINRTLTEREPTEGMILFQDADEKHIQGYTAVLRDSEGDVFGALIVLNDLTRVRKLENLRKDFVANVSHELRTPITTIKGFVETLVDGALERPPEAARFLNIIAKQVDRLDGIIEDLLSLSWIEESGGKGSIERESHSLYEVLTISIEACEIRRKEKDVTIVLNCSKSIRVDINAPLFEQAVINLIDNAIKYSDPGKTVTVSATQTAEETAISVIDNGSGIPAEHIPRLFERFYRVDKARSRKLGGTGLGLAIVKHIALAHGGTVDVDSTVGVGTTFTIHLPSASPTNG